MADSTTVSPVSLARPVTPDTVGRVGHSLGQRLYANPDATISATGLGQRLYANPDATMSAHCLGQRRYANPDASMSATCRWLPKPDNVFVHFISLKRCISSWTFIYTACLGNSWNFVYSGCFGKSWTSVYTACFGVDHIYIYVCIYQSGTKHNAFFIVSISLQNVHDGLL